MNLFDLAASLALKPLPALSRVELLRILQARNNTAVLRLHQRFGFQVEGVRRRHIYRDGEWIDTVLLGMTRDEWTARRAEMACRVERRQPTADLG